MPPRIAIPLPNSIDSSYSQRALPQYERAVEFAGGEPVPIPFDLAQARELMTGCDGVLLPGSNADVDPAKFNAERSAHTAAPDSRREDLDQLLLEEAYRLHKPVLGICYGLQSLNVYRAGSLVQHIPDFLPPELRTLVNHEAGKLVPVAHTVEIDTDSKLAEIITANKEGLSRRQRNWAVDARGHDLVLPVNSSHHQAADAIGEGLRIVARCEDGIIEAIEGTSPDHFVVAVQWHPERSVQDDPASRAIFRALIQAEGEPR